MRRGLFISFEGSEGCGKSTQIQRLARRLSSLKQPFILTREPGGTVIGEEIRHLLLLSKAGHGMHAATELLLFAASRAQLVREVIEPALQAGKTVVADRFLDSTTVYQGVARRLRPAAVASINRFAVGTCLPDLTFILDLDVESARARLRRRARPIDQPDRIEREPAEFYERIRAGYRRLAKIEPLRTRLLDGSRPAAELEETIWGHLSEKLRGTGKKIRV